MSSQSEVSSCLLKLAIQLLKCINFQSSETNSSVFVRHPPPQQACLLRGNHTCPVSGKETVYRLAVLVAAVVAARRQHVLLVPRDLRLHPGFPRRGFIGRNFVFPIAARLEAQELRERCVPPNTEIELDDEAILAVSLLSSLCEGKKKD
jgi:hypothetical protein